MSGFDDFWKHYPRKVSKLEAMRAWKQMTRDYAPEEIIAGLLRQLPTLSRKERQFIKHPATWLRAGCWMDEPETTGPRNYAEAARNIVNGSEGIFGGRHDDERLPLRH